MATGLVTLFRRLASSGNAGKRQPDMTSALKKLLDLQVPIGSIIDVGVQSGTEPLSTVFNDRFHLLVEPVSEWNDEIQSHYCSHGVAHAIENCAASDADGDVTLKLKSVLPGSISSHAFMVEEERGAGEFRQVPMFRVDTLMSKHSLAEPYLLKIDVDGAEMRVIEGAAETLKLTNVVVLEAGVHNLVERLVLMRSLGFEPFDIVDICYYDGRFVQVDVVFIRLSCVQELGLDFYRDGFDPDKWSRHGVD